MGKMRTACLAGLLSIAMPLGASAPLPSQPAPGEFPPDALGTLKGQPISVSQHRGKVVIVTFWASWCGPCRRELPLLARLQKTVGRDHLEVIAVNYKEDRRDYLAVLRANREFEMTYVHDASGVISDSYGVRAVPNMFVIDRDGKVAHVHRGYSEQMIPGLIQEMLALLPQEALNRPVDGT
ncbi:TlpA disulfide reductase family protein [Aerolutibacter daejeonensis]|uniref:TlpA disulfide reductase family protein n=1 Tax=Aerolutibacter daejeonensis TaxID=346181 RepID=UPI00068EEF89|nr:TlpA disulfide reductase family protein [Lysobacter daejeonensis]